MENNTQETLEIKTGVKAGYDYDFELSAMPSDVAIPW
jgi:hypothetical protein